MERHATAGKRVYAKSVSRVRISVTPLKFNNPASTIARGIILLQAFPKIAIYRVIRLRKRLSYRFR